MDTCIHILYASKAHLSSGANPEKKLAAALIILRILTNLFIEMPIPPLHTTSYLLIGTQMQSIFLGKHPKSSMIQPDRKNYSFAS